MSQIRLSDAQRSVVEHQGGSLLVVAGPGSGKTRVLTERIRHLLDRPNEHFRILALTFTNKAANEMRERLDDIGQNQDRVFLGTLHQFCLDTLAERGKRVGVKGPMVIFESFSDRKRILTEAAQQDRLLGGELEGLSHKDRDRLLGDWLNSISLAKACPTTLGQWNSPLEQALYDAYCGGLRASNAYDFDDILLLCYQLFSENPKVAELYRNIYPYLCVDEAQDLNEAQYCVIKALCGEQVSNVLMVGDPKQSIYGFSSASPEYMERFVKEFRAERIELTQNFRSSRSIVRIAQALAPTYQVAGQLAIAGEAALIVGQDQADEAHLVVEKLQALVTHGHPDIEGPIQYDSCAMLGRSRFALLVVEQALKAQKIPFFKRLSALHTNESPWLDDFMLGIRLLVNPADLLHRNQLLQRWNATPNGLPISPDICSMLMPHAQKAGKEVVVRALQQLGSVGQPADLLASLALFKNHATTLTETQQMEIEQDLLVLGAEWDHYLRTRPGGSASLKGFLGSLALGTTQQPNGDGVALLTVHSSKGLEFDVVFIVGMVQGGFPDFRARTPAELEEEKRNAFVAVTRSRRLLYLSWYRTRMTDWGEQKSQARSPFLAQMGF